MTRGYKHWTTGDEKFLRDNEDKSDQYLAEKLGRTIIQIRGKKRKLGINKLWWKIEGHTLNSLLTPLYEKGMSDRRMALASGISRHTIIKWRQGNDLEANGQTETSFQLKVSTLKRKKKAEASREFNTNNDPDAYRTRKAKPGSHLFEHHTEDQVEFMFACRGRMQHLGKKELSPSEILEVALSLGYRRETKQ